MIEHFPTRPMHRSKLDHAVLASVAAMAIFILAQQFDSAPAFAAAGIEKVQPE